VHPKIAAILERRCKSKAGDAPVFPECEPRGKDKRPSKGLSQPFTRYRRAVGVADGADFHSFRRCFATALKNEAANGNSAANEVVAGALMGHKAESPAFGRYGGEVERLDALRKGVEAVDYGEKVTALI
jgi:integrase